MQRIYECLNRTVVRAMARDKVKRNVVALCGAPTGKPGRPSKSLTLDTTKAVLNAAENTRLYAYVVLSLLTGARTEELRALTWARVDLDGRSADDTPLPPSIQVWHSVREGGDTKTRKSRRTLALPRRGVAALRAQRDLQKRDRETAGKNWHDLDLYFAHGSERLISCDRCGSLGCGYGCVEAVPAWCGVGSACGDRGGRGGGEAVGVAAGDRRFRPPD